ncbi:MAG TPA: hypothetical protein VMR34_03780 [Candidatus Saccharimonadales bacterium]|nr:hypothetical protein [Candidatus Saccharimonadales bacterium]
MKAVILYHKTGENFRAIEEFANDLKRDTSKEVVLVDLESPEGDQMAKVYDILNYPAVLILREDGQLSKGWQNGSLPASAEVLGYLNV